MPTLPRLTHRTLLSSIGALAFLAFAAVTGCKSMVSTHSGAGAGGAGGNANCECDLGDTAIAGACPAGDTCYTLPDCLGACRETALPEHGCPATSPGPTACTTENQDCHYADYQPGSCTSVRCTGGKWGAPTDPTPCPKVPVKCPDTYSEVDISKLPCDTEGAKCSEHGMCSSGEWTCTDGAWDGAFTSAGPTC